VNGVDATQYQPLAALAGPGSGPGLRNKFVAGYLGTHGLAHALDRLVEAAALLSDRQDIVFSGLLAGCGVGSVEAMWRSENS